MMADSACWFGRHRAKYTSTHNIFTVTSTMESYSSSFNLTIFFYRRHLVLTQADTAVSGKLILAKYVHSEIEKEEEEVFVFFFSLLVTQDRAGGGGSVTKIVWQ